MPLGLMVDGTPGQRQRLFGQRHCRGERALRHLVRTGRRRLHRRPEPKATGRASPGHRPVVSADRAATPRTACPRRSPRPRPPTRAESHANVTTVAQAWAAIGSAYPVLICSNISFEATRNEEGIIAATGHAWPHCMLISSRRTSPKYGRLYLVHQFWTPAWTSGPYYLDQPAGSFWITEEDLAKILVCQWDRRTMVRDCWTSAPGIRALSPARNFLPHWVKTA